jgi:predicted acyl esterase
VGASQRSPGPAPTAGTITGTSSPISGVLGTAGLLAPCASDDQLAQAGPWAISYTSAPLAQAATIARPVATVYASATTAQTELVAELEDVAPSGASYPPTEGALLGSLRAVNKKRSWTADGVIV